ncbi:MAG: hypothetical protein ACI4UV_15820 [Victivallales bacterium]
MAKPVDIKLILVPGNLNRAARRGNTAALRRSSAYIRKVARNRIKKRKNYDTASKPGQSPYTHGEGRFFKNSIVFSVEGNTAYIGPAVFPGSDSRRQIIGAIHEFGGTVKPVVGSKSTKKTTDWNSATAGPIRIKKGVMVFGKLKSKKQRKRAARIFASGAKLPKARRKSEKLLRLELAAATGKRFHYAPRPTMGPALTVSMPYIAGFWKNVIKV